jgi:capsular polysaccharide biosynthesis protein
MRILESEDELVTELKARLKGHAEVREFRSQDTTIRQAIGLFHRALVVIGVHGGALANTVFCRPGTLLAEIAFRAPQVRHAVWNLR